MAKSNNVNGKYLLLVPAFLGQLLQERKHGNPFHPHFVSLLQSQIEHLDSPVDLGGVSIIQKESPYEDFSYWEFHGANDLEVQRVFSIIESIQIKLIYDTRNTLMHNNENSNILILKVEKISPSFGPSTAVVGMVEDNFKMTKLEKSFSIYACVSFTTKFCIFKYILNDFFADNPGGMDESIKLAIERELKGWKFTIEYFKNMSNILIMVHGHRLLELKVKESFKHMFPNKDVILPHENTNKLSDFVTKQLRDFYFLKAINFFYIQYETVEEYLKMRRYLKSCEEISKLKEKIETLQNKAHEICQNKENEFIMPFIFICSSSGTGKTQIPFTLDEPLLYFLYDTKVSDKPKGIRTYFINQSVELFKYLNMDLNNYMELSEQNKETSNYKHYTVGFLVSFMRSMAENKRQSHSPQHWICYQLQVPTKQEKSMTFDEGRKELEDIKNKFILINDFIIFMDECCVPDEEECINRFRFFRKIIRDLNLVLIVMGTNDDSANIVDCELSRNIRSREWCYIMFKLPKTSKEWMEKEKKKFLERNGSLDDEIKAFINLMTKLCGTERPLIASIVLKSLFNLIEINKHKEPRITVQNIFLNILEQIHQTFRYNKPDEEKVFLTGQFAMISSTFWDQNPFVSQRLTSAIIKKHVAYLYGNPFLNEDRYFIEIHWNNSKLRYKNRIMFNQFIPCSTFPSFNHEPLTLMALSIAKPSWPIFPILVTNENQLKFLRISTIDAFHEIKYQRAPFYTLTSTAMDGFALEMLFNAACVAASHSGGFRNLSFTDWILNLIDELSLDRESFGENKWSTFNKNYWDKIKIPYCFFGFSKNTTINNELKTFLKDTFNCDFAVANCHFGSETRDFHMKKLCKNEIIITAECKCYKDAVKFHHISQIVQKISKYESKNNIVSSSVYIIFANRFEISVTSINNYKMKNSGEETTKNKKYKNSLYKLKKEINGQYSIYPIVELDPQKPPFLLIDLSEINRGKDCDFLFK